MAGLLVSSGTVSAQLEEKSRRDWTTVGELKYIATTRARLQYSAVGKDTSYILLFKDARKEFKDHYFTIGFSGADDTRLRLYALLTSFFSAEHKNEKSYEKTFRLGEAMVHVQHYRKIATPGIMLTTEDGFIILTENEINRLFGRR